MQKLVDIPFILSSSTKNGCLPPRGSESVSDSDPGGFIFNH